jgi:hypothetical protein
MRLRSVEMEHRGALLHERARTLRELLAHTEDRVAAVFEHSALLYPDRAASLRSLARQARDFAMQLREESTKD